jgi:hypothetical protein
MRGLLSIAGAEERMGWGMNVFGSIPRHRCLRCGPVWARPIEVRSRDLEFDCTVIDLQCPYCGLWEIAENTDGIQPAKVLRRYTTHFHRYSHIQGAA